MKRSINNKTRFILQILSAIILTLTSLLLSYTLFLKDKSLDGLIAICVGVFAFVAMILFLKKRYAEIKKDTLQYDERTIRVLEASGVKSFLISLYWLLAIMWYYGSLADRLNLPKSEVEPAISLGILGMVVIYGLCYLYYRNKEFI